MYKNIFSSMITVATLSIAILGLAGLAQTGVANLKHGCQMYMGSLCVLNTAD